MKDRSVKARFFLSLHVICLFYILLYIVTVTIYTISSYYYNKPIALVEESNILLLIIVHLPSSLVSLAWNLSQLLLYSIWFVFCHYSFSKCAVLRNLKSTKILWSLTIGSNRGNWLFVQTVNVCNLSFQTLYYGRERWGRWEYTTHLIIRIVYHILFSLSLLSVVSIIPLLFVMEWRRPVQCPIYCCQRI